MPGIDGSKIKNKFAVATHAAKNLGFRGFKKGSAGADKRSDIAEALKRGASRRASKR